MKPPLPRSYSKALFTGCAFTLVELLTVIAVVGILAFLLFPVLARSKDSAETTKCATHMRQWGVAVLLYVNEHKGDFPNASFPTNTHAILAPYLDSKMTKPSELEALYGCPVDQWKYAFNSYLSPGGTKYGALTSPADHIYGIELSNSKSDNRWLTISSVQSALAGVTPKPHRGKVNVLFVDGHVTTSRVSDLKRAQITRDSPPYKASDISEPLGDPKFDQ